MNTFQQFLMTIAAAVTLLLFAGAVYADIPVPAVQDLAGLSTVTSMDAQGIATTHTETNLQLGTRTLNDSPMQNGGFLWSWFPQGSSGTRIVGYSVDPFVISRYKGAPVPPGEVQYTMGYNEALTSVSGRISLPENHGCQYYE